MDAVKILLILLEQRNLSANIGWYIIINFNFIIKVVEKQEHILVISICQVGCEEQILIKEGGYYENVKNPFRIK